MPKPPPPPTKPHLSASFEEPDEGQTFQSSGSVSIATVLSVTLVDPDDGYGPPTVTFEVRPFPADPLIPPTAAGKGTEQPNGSYRWAFVLDTPGQYVIDATVTSDSVDHTGAPTLTASPSRRFGFRRTET